MPSFVIDELYVGDIVNGEVVLRDAGYREIPEAPEEPIYQIPEVPVTEKPIYYVG